MALLDVIEVKSGEHIRRIELHQGDLTHLAVQDAVDLLILSAFRGECLPTSKSLIGALAAKGLSVYNLSHNKAMDLRQAFSCWLSHPLQATHPDLQFDRILCFEPPEHSYAPDFIHDIFRALAPFIVAPSISNNMPPIRKVAMPVVASGCQGYPIEILLPLIVKAAMRWMETGIPLETLKIFTYSDVDTDDAEHVFPKLKLKTQSRLVASTT